MNELMNIGTEQTMSSKDITILLNEGKPKEQCVRHDNVKRTMERLADRGVILVTPMEEPIVSGKGGTQMVNVLHKNIKVSMERLQDRGVISFTAMQTNPAGELGGRPGTVYHVSERDSYIIVAQLSPEFAAAIVDHWRQLKGENEDLKELVIAQGKKIDALADKLLEMVPASKCAVDVPQSITKKVHGRRGVPITKHEVKQIKLFADKGKVKDDIADLTGFSRRTVYKVLKGERDYLLKA